MMSPAIAGVLGASFGGAVKQLIKEVLNSPRHDFVVPAAISPGASTACARNTGHQPLQHQNFFLDAVFTLHQRTRASGAGSFFLSRCLRLLAVRLPSSRSGGVRVKGAKRRSGPLTRRDFSTLVLCGASRLRGLHRMASLSDLGQGAGGGQREGHSTGRAGAGGAAASTEPPHYFGGCVSACLCHHG
jgi:hypothetical protein